TRVSVPTPWATAAPSARASASVVFIFQLPATNFLRGMRFFSCARLAATRSAPLRVAAKPSVLLGCPELAAEGTGAGAEVAHQVEELMWQQRLRAVRERLLGTVVNFDVNAVGSCRDTRPAHARNEIRAAGRVARIDDDRQMRLPLHVGHGRHVKHVAGA